jgi:quercetin dioxygenase-like cupin family protein
MTQTRTAVLAVIGFGAVAGLAAATFGQGHGESMSAMIHRPESLKWQDAPASLPPGAKIALLEGDPSKPGPFVVRFRFPNGYRVAPHTHPKPERVTVISGVLRIGMGAKYDASKTEAMPAGTFGTWPAGMKHYGWFQGETVIQLHGEGPWTVNYLDPADDPRNVKK